MLFCNISFESCQPRQIFDLRISNKSSNTMDVATFASILPRYFESLALKNSPNLLTRVNCLVIVKQCTNCKKT